MRLRSAHLAWTLAVVVGCGDDGGKRDVIPDGGDMQCTADCGDGVVTGAEVCDDGNTVGGDGCAADCSMTESGFDCVAGPTGGPATTCTPHCGDGLVVGNETCDDMNADPSDGCIGCQIDAGCATGETAVVLRSATSVPIPDDNENGVLVPLDVTPAGAITKLGVIVDLTHTYDGDVRLYLVGPTGKVRALSRNHGTGANYTGTWFRDDAATAIDDGGSPFAGRFRPEESLATTIGADFLDGKAAGTWAIHAYDTVFEDSGTLDMWTLVACVDRGRGYCGDGHVDAGEECDDGNTDDTDACKTSCKLRCGDGVVDPGEECDDLNHTAGDGCSATCQFDCPDGSTLVTGSQAIQVAIGNDDDGSGVESTLALAGMGGISLMRVTLDQLTFPDTHDLDVSIVSPSGVSRLLSSQAGVGANFTNTLFVDRATTHIVGGTNPFTGTFRPIESMATSAGLDNLDGELAGTWKLHVVNTANVFTGSIGRWTISACVGR